MNPADEMVAKIESPKLAGAVPGSDHKPDEHPSLEDFQRLLAMDRQTKRAPESQTKRRASPAFVRYLVAICIGVAGTLAWQSYGEAIKQVIAIRAPELGWSPESKQMIASWVEQLGWTKPPAGPENAAVRPSAPAAQIAPETVASKAAAPASLDAGQLQQIVPSLAALRQTVDQLAVGQDKMAREINKLAADVETLSKIPAHPPLPPAAPARKPVPAPLPPSSRTPTTALTPHP